MKKLVMLSIALLTVVPAFSMELEYMQRDMQWQKRFRDEIQRPVSDLIALLKKMNKNDDQIKEVTDLSKQVGGPTPLEQLIIIAKSLGSKGEQIAMKLQMMKLQMAQMELQRVQRENSRLLMEE